MKNHNNIVLICFGLMMMVSCTKGFDEMNVNPLSPTGTTTEALFNGVIGSLQLPANEQFYLNNEIFYPETELGALTSDAWGNYSIGTEAVWTNYYYALSNIRDINKRLDDYCTENNDNEICDKVKAQVIVLKAYKTFKVTDIFGDIPYFGAAKIWFNSSSTANMRPPFDSQDSIYKSLLNELVWARNVLNSTATTTTAGNEYYTVGASDVLFASNYNKWAKFANSLILRHGLRMYQADPDFAKPILVDAYNKPVIDDYDGTYNGGVCLWPTYLNFTNENVHWSFREHKNLRMGETIWKVMSSTDSLNGSGIFDYRIFVFFDTSHKTDSFPSGAWRPYPQIRNSTTSNEGGTPYASTRDNNYEFKGPACLFSPFNYYLIRDNIFIPEILLTSADVLFVKAEIAALGIAGSQFDMIQYYSDGIMQSCLFWNQMINKTPRWTYRYQQYTNFVNNYASEYDACYQMAFKIVNQTTQNNPEFGYTNEEYLHVIRQQRWVNLFRQPWEAWALARRTMDTPTTTNHQKLTSYRMPYPQTEIEYNYQNYTEQVQRMNGGDKRSTKIWWMTNEN